MEIYKRLQINISGYIGTFQFCEVDFLSDNMHIRIDPAAQIGPILPRPHGIIDITLPYADIDGYRQSFFNALSMQTNAYIVHHNTDAPKTIRIIGAKKLQATFRQFGINPYRPSGFAGLLYRFSPVASAALIVALIWWLISTHQLK